MPPLHFPPAPPGFLDGGGGPPTHPARPGPATMNLITCGHRISWGFFNSALGQSRVAFEAWNVDGPLNFNFWIDVRPDRTPHPSREPRYIRPNPRTSGRPYVQIERAIDPGARLDPKGPGGVVKAGELGVSG